MSSLFQTLKQARLQQKLSQETLGRKLKIPQNHISQMEAGKVDVRTTTLVAWARAVGLEILVVPREVVPVIEHFKKEISHSGARNAERSPPALYEVTETEDDDQPSQPRP